MKCLFIAEKDMNLDEFKIISYFQMQTNRKTKLRLKENLTENLFWLLNNGSETSITGFSHRLYTGMASPWDRFVIYMFIFNLLT